MRILGHALIENKYYEHDRQQKQQQQQPMMLMMMIMFIIPFGSAMLKILCLIYNNSILFMLLLVYRIVCIKVEYHCESIAFRLINFLKFSVSIHTVRIKLMRTCCRITTTKNKLFTPKKMTKNKLNALWFDDLIQLILKLFSAFHWMSFHTK